MAEAQLPPSSDGGVVLDIGGDIGALVLMTEADLDRVEIDLEPDDARQPHTHSAVRRRDLLDGSASYAAVYPVLKAGTYTIEGSHQKVTIVGGEVAQLRYEPLAHPHGYDHVHDEFGNHVHVHH